jgi:hypothetical protein
MTKIFFAMILAIMAFGAVACTSTGPDLSCFWGSNNCPGNDNGGGDDSGNN